MLACETEVLATEAEAETKAFRLQCRDRGQDQDVQSQGRGETEAFEISTEGRPSQGTTAPRRPRDRGVKTEATSLGSKFLGFHYLVSGFRGLRFLG